MSEAGEVVPGTPTYERRPNRVWPVLAGRQAGSGALAQSVNGVLWDRLDFLGTASCFNLTWWLDVDSIVPRRDLDAAVLFYKIMC